MAVTIGRGGGMSIGGPSNPFAPGGQYNRPGGGGGRSGGGGGSSGGGGGRSGGGGGSGGSTETSVSISDNTVFINGQGFSVAQGELSSFLQSKGLSGGSYQAALEKAKQADQAFKKEAEAKLKATQEYQNALEFKKAQAQQNQEALINIYRQDVIANAKLRGLSQSEINRKYGREGSIDYFKEVKEFKQGRATPEFQRYVESQAMQSAAQEIVRKQSEARKASATQINTEEKASIFGQNLKSFSKKYLGYDVDLAKERLTATGEGLKELNTRLSTREEQSFSSFQPYSGSVQYKDGKAQVFKETRVVIPAGKTAYGYSSEYAKAVLGFGGENIVTTKDTTVSSFQPYSGSVQYKDGKAQVFKETRVVIPAGESSPYNIFLTKTNSGMIAPAPFNILKAIGGKVNQAGEFVEASSLTAKSPYARYGGQIAGGALQFTGELIPKNALDVAAFYGGYKAYKAAPKIVSSAFTLIGGKQFVEGETIAEKTKGGITATLGGLGLLSELKTLKGGTIRQKELSLSPGTPAGKRPTLIITEEGTGRTLLEIDKNTRQAILPGGGANKGESARQAAIREAGEELLGMKGRSYKEIEAEFTKRGLEISKKPTDILQTEEEFYTVFTGKVKDLEKFRSGLKPQAKEITALEIINPVKKYTGKTAKNIFGETGERWFDKIKPIRKAPIEIRSQDLLLLSRARVLEKFNTLSSAEKSALAKAGMKYLVKTGGRTKVKQIKSIFGEEALARDVFLSIKGQPYRRLIVKPTETSLLDLGEGELASAVRGKNIFKRVISPTEARAKESFAVRGKNLFVERDKGGKFIRQYVIGKEPGTVVSFGSRYRIPFKELAKYKSQELRYLSASPMKPETGLFAYSDMGAKRLLKEGSKRKGGTKINLGADVKIESITGLPENINKQFEVLGSKSKRGGEGLYFQPPTTPYPKTSEYYLGPTYLGIFGKPSEGAGFTFRRPKPVILTKKGTEGFIQTKKAKLGIEFERAAPPASEFVVVGKGTSFGLGGFKVRKYEIELVKQGSLSAKERAAQRKLISALQKQNRESEILAQKIYISPYGLSLAAQTKLKEKKVKDIISEGVAFRPSKISIIPYSSRISPREKTKGYTSGGYKPGKYNEKPYLSKPTEKPMYSYVREKVVTPLKYYKQPTYKEGIFSISKPKKVFGFTSIKKQYRQPASTGKFTVFLRRYGKFRPIATTSDVKKAFLVGEQRARTTLGRTFKVTGQGKLFKVPKGFYSKVSKKEGTVFIQKAKTSLSSIGEIKEIKQARNQMVRI